MMNKDKLVKTLIIKKRLIQYDREEVEPMLIEECNEIGETYMSETDTTVRKLYLGDKLVAEIMVSPDGKKQLFLA